MKILYIVLIFILIIILIFVILLVKYKLNNIEYNGSSECSPNVSLDSNKNVNVNVNVNYKKLYFPPFYGANPKITKVGLYSSTPYIYNTKFVDILKSYLGKDYDFPNKTLIDATSCIGSDSIALSYYFGKVISIEIDPLNYSTLKHNIKEYKRNNITTYNEDSIKLLPKLIKNYSPDILYIDAPWGGKTYKENEYVNLYMSNINIADIVKKYLNKFDCIILKVPKNFNKSSLTVLFSEVNFPKFNLLFIKN